MHYKQSIGYKYIIFTSKENNLEEMTIYMKIFV